MRNLEYTNTVTILFKSNFTNLRIQRVDIRTLQVVCFTIYIAPMLRGYFVNHVGCSLRPEAMRQQLLPSMPGG